MTVKVSDLVKAAPAARAAVLKELLNDAAGRYFARKGYSPEMTRDAKQEAWWWFQTRKAALRHGVGVRRGWGIVWPEPGRTELLPLEVAAAGPGEVTVGLAYTAVSAGTERAQYLQLPSAEVKFPYRPGYSGSGVVVAVGRGVDGVHVGDWVAVRGAPHASVVTAPASSVQALPPGVDPAAAAFIQLGVIAAQGVACAGVSRGDTVCVVGAGIVGGLAAQASLAAGAASVVVVAASRRREHVLRAAGAAAFHTADDRAALEAIGADVVIEASGSTDAVEVALAAVRDGGRIAILGSPRGMTESLDLGAIRSRGIRLVGAHVSTLSRQGGAAAWAAAAARYLRDLAENRIDPARLVTTRVEPDAVGALYRGLGRGEGVVGALIDWHALPVEERDAPGVVLRLPKLDGAGAAPSQAPLRRRLPGHGDGSRPLPGRARLASLRPRRVRRRRRPERRRVDGGAQHEPRRLLRHDSRARRRHRPLERHRGRPLSREPARPERRRRRLPVRPTPPARSARTAGLRRRQARDRREAARQRPAGSPRAAGRGVEGGPRSLLLFPAAVRGILAGRAPAARVGRPRRPPRDVRSRTSPTRPTSTGAAASAGGHGRPGVSLAGRRAAAS